MRRDRRRHRRVSEAVLEFDPQYIRQLSQEESEQLPRPLLRAMRGAWNTELTECQRRYLLLYYRDDMTMCEIAARCGVNQSTVSRTLHRARERLRRVLQYYV